MKIEAIRLSEVGRYREAVTLDGFSGGLDVLVGPNEAGKSTLFRALETVFKTKHGANTEHLRDLRPYGGGAPFVECDFTEGGRRYRLAKRYLAAPMAELVDRDSGQRWRGADAENQLVALMDGATGPRAMLTMLWVAQGDSFKLPEPDAGGHQRIAQLIEREIEAASGAGRLADVAARVQRELASHLTEKAGRPRTGSAYAKALADVEALRRETEAARLKAAQSLEARAQVGRAHDQLARLADVSAKAARVRWVEETQAAISVAREGRQGLTAAEAARSAASDAEAAARAAYDRIAADIAALDQAERRIAEAMATAGQLVKQVEDARVARSAAEAHSTATGERLAAVRAGVRLARAEQRLAEHREALDQAEDAVRRIAHIKAWLAEIRIDERAMRALADASRAIDADERALAAEAGEVAVAYEAGREGAITVDGTPIAANAAIALDRPLVLVVAGIGRIRVTPGGGALSERHRQLGAARARLAHGLAAAGVGDLAEAEELLEQRRAHEAELREAEAQLWALSRGVGVAKLAASGVALVRERDAAAAALAGLPGGSELALRGIGDEGEYGESALEELEREATLATHAFHRTAAEVAAIDVRLAAERAKLATEQRRREELAALPQSVAERDAALAEAARLVASARQAADEAALEVRALRERVPDADGMRGLEAKAAKALADQQSADVDIARLREEIARLEAGLARDDMEGIGARAIEVAEQLAAAERRRDAFEREIGALRLLGGELERASAVHRAAIVTPVAARLERLAPRVLADARVAMDATFTLTGLSRAGHEEAVGRLSDGTREQLAILARLAYARVLADAGHPVPLVLDDALVFADDGRLDAMIAVLAEASRHHQVIVLTCHAQSVGALAERHGGRLLTQSAWQRAAA